MQDLALSDSRCVRESTRRGERERQVLNGATIIARRANHVRLYSLALSTLKDCPLEASLNSHPWAWLSQTHDAIKIKCLKLLLMVLHSEDQCLFWFVLTYLGGRFERSMMSLCSCGKGLCKPYSSQWWNDTSIKGCNQGVAYLLCSIE